MKYLDFEISNFERVCMGYLLLGSTTGQKHVVALEEAAEARSRQHRGIAAVWEKVADVAWEKGIALGLAQPVAWVVECSCMVEHSTQGVGAFCAFDNVPT